jgi:alkylhydroperoxidase/carboxymuconolactone decarboxylase family protein YurZ
MGDVAYAADELAVGLDWIGEVAPGAALSFRALVASTLGEGRKAPTSKGRALLSLALATTGCCECCVDRQTRAAAIAGASRDEVIATLQRAVMIADGAAMAVGAASLALFDELMCGSSAPRAELEHAAERYAARDASTLARRDARASGRRSIERAEVHGFRSAPVGGAPP